MTQNQEMFIYSSWSSIHLANHFSSIFKLFQKRPHGIVVIY